MLMSPKECKDTFLELGGIVIVPAYMNAGTIGTLMASLIKYSEDILVVNDGSTDSTAAILSSFGFREISMEQAENPAPGDIRKKVVLTHGSNLGKGAALKHALTAARRAGYRIALTIDADGQHFPQDIPDMVQAACKYPGALIAGERNLDAEDMPSGNRFANRFSNFWFRLYTGVRLNDTQCGFRIYPLEGTDFTRPYYTSLYEFELEAMVFACWSGKKIIGVPVRADYLPEEERVSHFRPFRDFMRITLLNTLLLIVCFLWIWPRNILRKCTWKNIKRFFDKNFFHSDDSNARLAMSVWVGILVGLMPFYGYQLLLAVFLAHVFGLNKLVAGVFSTVSIPPLVPFIVYGSYRTGCAVLGQAPGLPPGGVTFENMLGAMWQYIIGGFVFAAAVSMLCALLCFVILLIFRKK